MVNYVLVPDNINPFLLISRKCGGHWEKQGHSLPRRKFVHEVMNFDGAFMNVHVNS